VRIKVITIIYIIMNNQSTIFPKKRKANCKKLICPFTGREIDTRGVPAYLRNKYGIRWERDFLTNSELVLKKSKQKEIEDKLAKFRYWIWVFSQIDDKFKTMIIRMDKELKDYVEKMWEMLNHEEAKDCKKARDLFSKFRSYLKTKPDLFYIIDI